MQRDPNQPQWAQQQPYPPPQYSSQGQPYFQPPPQKPKMSKNKRAGIGCGVIIAIIVIFAILANVGSHGSSTIASTTTKKANTTNNTTPIVTPQVRSTPTPKRTSPTRTQIDDLIAPLYPPVTVESYKQNTGTLVVSLSYGEGVNWTQNIVKKSMADTQAQFWQQSWYFSSITVNVYELLLAGGQRKVAYGVLTYQTAQTVNFQWGLYGDLWDTYNQKFIDPRVPNE